MKWEGNRESDNVEDRRGDDNSGGGGGSGIGGRHIGIGSIVIALVASYFFGVNPLTVLSLLSGGGSGQVSTSQTNQSNHQVRPAANDRETKFVRTVLADTEDVWKELFSASSAQYTAPHLVIFDTLTSTACGKGESATGPFYCPSDRKVYIDLSFYRLMRDRFHVSGEFAQAYVIAHEVGHHVQNLLGISDKVHDARVRASLIQGNALSVKMELQADCFAGVWAFHANQARSILEKGDVETALNAATAIGDDALQRKAQGQVVPDSFTHGSSEQRVRWFSRGLESGKMEQCDTFQAKQL
ncbi:neutral zinc metallopeptidase [Undibacterium sp. Jales W-56]|uniref:KPN_02809 family neutral zinc metallopeptidase n=1 Tax=Undibacterium sp. Jales W-56 TaxID=2897325 RepID=UPI0021CEB8E8|nr:neutral zinc metallopeptidase [Undibacterium sp. Jales W-56]MCU6435629.1 neutral zinc metallopeptidase [Undibacterium sp. Jales W-56]